MSKKLRVVLAQINLTVGDIPGNLAKLITSAHTARDKLAADIIVFPELSLTGYPPEDLLLRPAFLEAVHAALDTLKKEVHDIYCVVGYPHATSQGLFNSCAVIHNGTFVGRYAKQYLPNYGVFDECRYFTPGDSPCVIPIKGILVGILICEDLWHSSPIHQAANLGARLILAPNASPFEIDKQEQRHLILAARAKAANLPIVYTNLLGAQDGLIFDGGSMVVNLEGKIEQHAGFFNEILFPVDFEISSTQTSVRHADFTLPSIEQRIYDALVLGVRDYFHKNHFKNALVGVSGGIDSALTLAIAVDALGKDHVSAIFMPSRFTAEESLQDGLTLVNNLQVKHETIPIEPVFSSFLQSLAPSFAEKKFDVTEENIQARCRGIFLMALANKGGKIVLNTSNRSEMAVGYATLYGDMAGGYGVLKDVPKTLVYQLARYRNQIQPVIPENTLRRAPTAELAPDQKDQDSLPPYDVLDKIIELYINQQQSVTDIIAQGFDQLTVVKVINLIYKSEYKRQQAVLGTRINHKAFGRDRRYPITCGFKGKTWFFNRPQHHVHTLN